MKILIVDDTASIREVAAAQIIDCGHEAIKAASGLEAIEIIKSNRPDFVFMDVEMPELDGFETTRQIREILKDDWIPIIFLTSWNDDSYYKRGIDSGGDDYLAKPINQVVFQAKIKAMERIIEMKKNLCDVNKKLAKATITDKLTNLANRKGFVTHAEKYWKQCARDKTPISVAMIDVDHFKLYNDYYGHQEGDTCLRKVADALAQAAKRPMDLVARYGGEEFVCILPNTSLGNAETIAETMRLNILDLKLPHINSTTSDFVTVSVGVSAFDHASNHHLRDLIRSADNALYQSKHNGRNRVSTTSLRNQRKIMVVDEEKETIELLKILLHDHCEVMTMQSPTQCFDEVDKVHPDLIIADIEMSDISGYEFCKTIKENPQIKEIPVILTSNQKKNSVIKRCKEVGANGYIRKPFNNTQLLAKVTSFIC